MALAGRFLTGAAVALLAHIGFFISPAAAQDSPSNPSDPSMASDQNEGLREIGRTAETGIGQVGQRQTTSNAGPNVDPTGRVNNRIRSRVQNRISNRIDRYYDPKADTTEAFNAPGDQVRGIAR
jgi:hypothetical protein